MFSKLYLSAALHDKRNQNNKRMIFVWTVFIQTSLINKCFCRLCYSYPLVSVVRITGIFLIGLLSQNRAKNSLFPNQCRRKVDGQLGLTRERYSLSAMLSQARLMVISYSMWQAFPSSQFVQKIKKKNQYSLHLWVLEFSTLLISLFFF